MLGNIQLPLMNDLTGEEKKIFLNLIENRSLNLYIQIEYLDQVHMIYINVDILV
jgi:hypothetical protein